MLDRQFYRVPDNPCPNSCLKINQRSEEESGPACLIHHFFRCLSSLYLTSLPSLSYVCPFPYPSLTFTSVRHTFIAGLASSYRYAYLFERTTVSVDHASRPEKKTKNMWQSNFWGILSSRECTMYIYIFFGNNEINAD